MVRFSSEIQTGILHNERKEKQFVAQWRHSPHNRKYHWESENEKQVHKTICKIYVINSITSLEFHYMENNLIIR